MANSDTVASRQQWIKRVRKEKFCYYAGCWENSKDRFKRNGGGKSKKTK